MEYHGLSFFMCLIFVFISHSLVSGSCSTSQWKCDNGICIHRDLRCNNIEDCVDGSDEANCGVQTCSEGQKLCTTRNGREVCMSADTSCDCGPSNAVWYGMITLDNANNTLEGATAVLTCNEGYIPSPANISCLANGLWLEASCTGKDCGLLPTLKHGNLTLTDTSNTTYGASATVTCDDGFKANVSSIFCLSSGHWQPAACKAVDCGPPHAVLYGYISLADAKNTWAGATAVLNCNDGYISTSANISCLANGLWLEARCTGKDCGLLPTLKHGNLTLTDTSNTTYGSSATVTCDDGFEANVSSILCLSSGHWQTAACKAVDVVPPYEVKEKGDYTMIFVYVIVVLFGIIVIVQLILASSVNIGLYRWSRLSSLIGPKKRNGKEIHIDSKDNCGHTIGFIVLGTLPVVGIYFIRYRLRGSRGYEVSTVENQWYENEGQSIREDSDILEDKDTQIMG